MSGGKLILIIFGGLAVVIGFVLVGFTVLEPETAPCASGDIATNPLVDGRFQTRTELFAEVEDAEAFICHGVPELHAEGWALERIEAMRTVPIEYLVEGDGIGVVTLGYLQDSSGRPLTVEAAPFFGRSYFESQVPEQHTTDTLRVQGEDATVYRYGANPNQVDVIWQKDSLDHRATVQLGEEFTLDDLAGVLDTLE